MQIQGETFTSSSLHFNNMHERLNIPSRLPSSNGHKCVSDEAATANNFKVLHKNRNHLQFVQKAKLKKPGRLSQV